MDVSGTPDFSTGARRRLFSTLSFLIQPLHQGLAVTPDDRAFIMLQRTGTPATTHGRTFVMVRQNPAARIMVIQNLPALVERRPGAGGGTR